MNFIGIDPGKKGCVCSISEGGIISFAQFSEHEYVKFIALNRDAFAVVERVHSSPQMGVTSAFSFGENFGFIRGILTSYRVPYELVLPQKWKKHFGVTADKNTSIECAHRLFPEVSLYPSEICRKESDGMAESLLIAEYARRIYNRKYPMEVV